MKDTNLKMKTSDLENLSEDQRDRILQIINEKPKIENLKDFHCELRPLFFPSYYGTIENENKYDNKATHLKLNVSTERRVRQIQIHVALMTLADVLNDEADWIPEAEDEFFTLFYDYPKQTIRYRWNSNFRDNTPKFKSIEMTREALVVLKLEFGEEPLAEAFK